MNDAVDICVILPAYNEARNIKAVSGEIADISMSGVGVIIRGMDEEQGRNLAANPDFFMKLHFGKEVILAGWVGNLTPAQFVESGKLCPIRKNL